MQRTLSLLTTCLAGLAVWGVFTLSTGRVQAQAEERPAILVVRIAGDARLEIEGVATKQSGESRRFVSPPLVPGKKYTYTLKAVWTQDGKEKKSERVVTVQAGEETTIDLRETAAPPPAKKPDEPTKKPDESKKPVEPKKETPKKPDEPKKEAPPKKPDETKKPARQPDVIYVPTPQEVVDKMLELAEVKKGDVVYDLGCGDGRIVVTAAKKFGVKAIGFDIDPERIAESKDNVKKAKVEDLVTIKQEDIFALDLKEPTVVTLYLLPELNRKLMPKLKQLKPGSRIVSHDFDMGDWKPLKEVKLKDKDGTEHTVFLWKVGEAAAPAKKDEPKKEEKKPEVKKEDKKPEPKKEEPKKETPKEDKKNNGATAAAAAAEDKPKTPDVIYVPTPQEVVDKMLELAEVKKGDVVFDLGCGDGRIVVTAAKKYGVKAVGFDIDPDRIKDSNANVKAGKVGDLVTIKQEDIFKQDLSEANVITLYLLPTLNVKLMPQLEKMKPGSRIVSHDFDMRGAKPKKVVKVTPKGDNQREHTIYLWTIPLEKEAD